MAKCSVPAREHHAHQHRYAISTITWVGHLGVQRARPAADPGTWRGGWVGCSVAGGDDSRNDSRCVTDSRCERRPKQDRRKHKPHHKRNQAYPINAFLIHRKRPPCKTSTDLQGCVPLLGHAALQVAPCAAHHKPDGLAAGRLGCLRTARRPPARAPRAATEGFATRALSSPAYRRCRLARGVPLWPPCLKLLQAPRGACSLTR